MAMNPRLLRPLATFDPDAAAYLRAVEAADGQALETPVQSAVDDFIKGCKADGIWDAIKASCILCGARTLAGALVPLAGAAPTNDNFVDADYNRETGLVGDGATKYLDSNRANNADPQDDNHNVLWGSTLSVTGIEMGAGSNGVGANNVSQQVTAAIARSRTTSFAQLTRVDVHMLFGHSRSSAGEFKVRYNGATTTGNFASESPSSDNVFLFCRNNGSGTPEQFSPSRLAFYSIGESLDLALLDARVSALVQRIQRLMSDFRSIDEDGMDSDALAYIRNVEAADGNYLELGVKKAIDQFVRGCKYDGIWDSIKASCILCGARTLAGALTPLVGAAPTNVGGYLVKRNGFFARDYTRGGATPGLKGDGTSYLDSNYAFPAGLQNDMHLAGYVLEQPVALGFVSSSYGTPTAFNQVTLASSGTDAKAVLSRSRRRLLSEPPFGNVASTTVADANGFIGVSRSDSSTVDIRANSTQEADASLSTAVTALNQYIFCRNSAGTANAFFTGRIAFYSFGEATDLALLDARVTALVTAIGAVV